MLRLNEVLSQVGQRDRVEAEKAKRARLRKAEPYPGDAAALASSDAFRADVERAWLGTLR